MTLTKSMEAEREILGCLLYKRSVAAVFFSALNKKDFYLSYHQFLFSFLNEYFVKRQENKSVFEWRIDNFIHRLHEEGNLYAAGGGNYINALYSIGKMDFREKDLDFHIISIKKMSAYRNLTNKQQEEYKDVFLNVE